MYCIAICDDDDFYINEIKKIITKYYNNSCEIEILTFKDAREVIKDNSKIDVIFLDIEMPILDGILLKNKLENALYKGKIVYVTGYEQYMNEAFGINVIAYIKKNNLDRIIDVLDKIEKEKKQNKVININNNIINIKNITYIESDRGCINIHIGDEVLYFSIYLKDIMNRIDDDTFMKVHRSYIVNFQYIETYKHNEIILVTGEKVKISRNYREEFKERYFEYLTGV